MLLKRRLETSRRLSALRPSRWTAMLGTAAMAWTCIIATPHVLHAQPAGETQQTILPAQVGEAPAYAVMVPAQGLTHLEVSHPAKKLIRGHGNRKTQITLLPLDDKGVPIAEATPGKIVFPPNGLKDAHEDHLLSVAAHPTLPVIYVWRDLATRPNQVTPVNDYYREYEHLLIYDISADEPKLLLSGCKGNDFQIRRAEGIVSVSDDGRTLFMPNLTYGTRRGRGIAIGMYNLNDKGLPILQGAEPEPDVALPPPSEAEAEAEADEAVTSNRGGGLTMITLNETGSRFPGQQAFLIDKDHALVLSGTYLIGYNFASRASKIAAAYIPDSHPAHTRLSIHPTLPMAYIASGHNARINAWAHFKGYPSLMPQQSYMPHQPIFSFISVMAKRNMIAYGSQGRVVLVELDEQGWLTNTNAPFTVENNRVSLLTYEPRFDRLYVGTSQPLEKP